MVYYNEAKKLLEECEERFDNSVLPGGLTVAIVCAECGVPVDLEDVDDLECQNCGAAWE